MTPARLAYDVTGPVQAPVVVLGNSLGTNRGMWDPQVPALAERFRVLRFEHRGHGGSQTPAGPYTLEALGLDLLALLDDLGVQRAAFCGLSLGGMVGMWAAAHAPGRISRLALCCTSARIEPPTLWHDRAAQVRAHGTRSITQTVVARWFTPEFQARCPEEVARVANMLSDTSDEGYAGCCEAIAEADLRPDLTEIKAPTLVVAGEHDPATPVDHAERIVAGIDGSRLEVIPAAAHLANLEQPNLVTRLLLEHFSEVER